MGTLKKPTRMSIGYLGILKCYKRTSKVIKLISSSKGKLNE
jgi:hypothetical protein